MSSLSKARKMASAFLAILAALGESENSRDMVVEEEDVEEEDVEEEDVEEDEEEEEERQLSLVTINYQYCNTVN
jgi:hypothetical protein